MSASTLCICSFIGLNKGIIYLFVLSSKCRVFLDSGRCGLDRNIIFSFTVADQAEKRERQASKRSSHRISAEENTSGSPSADIKSPSLGRCLCDLPARPSTPTVFRLEEAGSCVSLVFNLCVSVRGGQGILWEGCSGPSCVYFGGQIEVSQQGARCHHCDLRTQAAGHHRDSREEGHSSMWDVQSGVRGQGCGCTCAQMSRNSLNEFFSFLRRVLL